GLKRLGYLTEMDAPFPTTKSLALFFHVNELKDSLRLYPWSLGAFEALPFLPTGRPLGALRLNFYEAVSGHKRAANPWHVEEITPGLAARVLKWLGYEVDDLEAFWRRNRKALRSNLKKSKLEVLAPEAAEEKLDFLDAVFSDASVRQQWRRPPEEAEIQLWLSRNRYLKARASQAEVQEALRRLLEEKGLSAPRSYAMMLCLGQEAIMSRGRKDPLSREPDPKRTSCEREK
ncbi:unnamed protein product, partial [Durusdinium trenchii]